ncbi:MAG: DUF2332 domain-containing protein [Arenibacterium sp.]
MTMTEALNVQSRACASLGSPFMGRLFALLAKNWPIETRIAALCDSWGGDIGPGGASLPLRLAGGLHALVLQGRDASLAAHYPPNQTDDTALMTEVARALAEHAAFIHDWMQSAPQTNEVRRSAALVPAAHYIAGKIELPFMTSELGASAGLNLAWDRYAVVVGDMRYGPTEPVLTLTPEWHGQPPVPMPIRVEDAQGVDLNPLDTTQPADALRLLSYLWPDQPERAALTRAAIAARNAPVHRSDAIDWLETRLKAQPDGRLHLIYHTIAWQYFPAAAQERGTALIEAAGSKATESRPLAWLSLENDGGDAGAALNLRLWPGDITLALGRADFHGRWVDWHV